MPTVINTPIVLQPYSIAEKDSKQNNRPQKNCTYPQVENITILPEHLFSLKKTTSRLLKRQRLCSIRVSHFPRRVSMIIFFQSKSFMRRRVRRYRLRHKIHAIKTRPNNPLHFLQRKNSIRRYLRNDLTCAARKTTFRTRKRFHNKQYTPKLKDQPFESERTHFDTGFNNSNVAMHRQTFIFLLPRQIATVQQKTTKTNSQKKQSKISQSKTRPKHTITNKHEKLSHQSIVKSITQTITTKITHTISQSKAHKDKHNKQLRQNAMFLNIIISQTVTTSEPTANTPFIKTQYNRKKQNNITYTLR